MNNGKSKFLDLGDKCSALGFWKIGKVDFSHSIIYWSHFEVGPQVCDRLDFVQELTTFLNSSIKSSLKHMRYYLLMQGSIGTALPILPCTNGYCCTASWLY